MISVALWSVSVLASPVLGEAGPTTAVVRAADDERPQRRSRDDAKGAPPIQMGMGPTALAMLAMVVAVVVRASRRRRASSATTL